MGAVLWVAACETIHGIGRDLDAVNPGDVTQGTGVHYASEPDIRVRVIGGAREARISGPASVIVRPAKAMRGDVTATPFTIAASPDGLRITDPRGESRTLPFGGDIDIMPAEAGGDAAAKAPIVVNGTRFPGTLSIRPRWNDNPQQIDIVASMPIETYLPGVLTGELLKDWKRQAYEAQSIASRTYALHERERARREGKAWDVEATDFDQVYAASSRTIAVEAARATRGRVLEYKGRLIRAYYSSTCGGRPSSASSVWPTGPGYEFNLAAPLQGKSRGHYCQRATFYRWSVTRDDDELSKRIRAWGKAAKEDVQDLTRLRKAQVRDTNDAGRPITFTLTDDSGRRYALTAEQLRVACNQSVPGLPAIARETRVNSGDMEVQVWADQVHITGRGWGHGVGMCQWCAEGMAEAGQDWATMLREFYPGASVVTAY